MPAQDRATTPNPRTAPGTASPDRQRGRSTALRPDIQGLRAFAVVVVVLDHLFTWPSGGFIGVDVFFVISGFLISGSLVREVESTGWVSLTKFYTRRARRILPAAVVVLAVTVLAAYVLWPVLRADQAALAAVASLFFVGNWHFATLGTDYLQADGPVSPLQHYWSLGVEEQFYILWPWTIVLVFAVGARFAATVRQRRLLACTFAGVITASFLLSLVVTAHNPTFAYFDSLSRIWELAAGALLAMAVGRLSRFPRVAGAVLQWAGLAVLVAALFVITPESAFPGPWAILPVAGAVLVIAGGCGTVPDHPLLTNRVTRYVGDISYSLYLWHFPVIVFTATIAGEGLAQWMFMIVLMSVLSVLSYHHVENRFRRPRPSKREGTTSAPGRRSDVAVAAVVTALVLGMTALQLVGPAAVTQAVPRSAPASAPGGATGPGSGADDADGRGPEGRGPDGVSATSQPLWDAERLQEAVHQAGADTAWPSGVEQRMRMMGPHEQPPQLFDPPSGCRNDVTSELPAGYCVREGPGEDPPVAVVVGDSVAVSWIPAVEAALPEWTVHGMGFANCPAFPVEVGSGGFETDCTEAQQTMRDVVSTVDADLVISSAAQSSLGGLASGQTGQAAADEWEAAIAEYVAGLPDREVVILGNPPAGAQPADCMAAGSTPQSCTTDVGSLWETKADAERAATRGTAARGTAAQGARVSYIDPSPWMCTDEGRCPAYADGTPFRFDGAHLTHEASVRLGGVLSDALIAAGAVSAD